MGYYAVHGTLLRNELLDNFTVQRHGEKPPFRISMSGSIKGENGSVMLKECVYIVLPPEGVTLPAMNKQDFAGSVTPFVSLQPEAFMREMEFFRGVEEILMVWPETDPERVAEQVESVSGGDTWGDPRERVQVRSQQMRDQVFHRLTI